MEQDVGKSELLCSLALHRIRYMHFILGFSKSIAVEINVFRTGPVIEPEKLPVHGSLVGPAVEPLSNRY